MAFADTLGAVATIANLGKGFSTTTIESKTNFFAGIPEGETAHAECTPLHRGRTTMVWQTRITRADGQLAAIVTQTQLVLAPRSGYRGGMTQLQLADLPTPTTGRASRRERVCQCV